MIRFVAEIGSNWVTSSGNKSWERAVKLIGAAYKAGCWGVKFQLFEADALYAPGYEEQIKQNKPRELPPEWIEPLAKVCHSLGLKFGCTPFNLRAVDILAPHVDWLKISSFDIRREGLIQVCMQTGKPIMISVGIARGRDIIRLKTLADEVNYTQPLTLMHCVSNYPTELKDCHMAEGLGRIMRLIGSGQIDPAVLGWSDHTVRDAAVYAAARLGAQVIECHYDIREDNEQGVESFHGHCWGHSQLKWIIAHVREMELALGPEGEWLEDKPEGWDKWLADPADGMRPLKEYR